MRIHPHLPTAIVATAWMMFLISFLLPTTNGHNGWGAFTTSILVMGAQPLIILAEPRVRLFLIFPFANLAMLLAPSLAFTWEWRPLLMLLLPVFGLIPWALPQELTGELFIGFYVWKFSFFLMAAGCLLSGLAEKSA